ncbi:LysM peptidoglycan-binding domain-containing protein [Bdellovibrio sp. HCB2-146]|uniref:LysM peptidoglycan-binding domain-containing protein n=1 Tax=Bdellovibrio sp. HCB2-146 TaxID=3394362 RepID=UPI0039BC4E9A
MRRKNISLISACVLTACLAQAQEEPDYSKESRFHDIYKKYNENPTPVEAWTKALGNRQAETYSVQKGDTLWDISQTLFGDSHFWPKVWSLNKGSILNPHEINPSMAIQFFAGDIEDAPTLELASAESVATTAEQQHNILVDTGDGNKEILTLPPSRRKRTAVLKKIPASIPQHRAAIAESRTVVEIELPKNQFPPATEYLGYYLNDGPVIGAGYVSSTEVDSKTASEFQYVYVQMDQPPEKHYVARRNGDKIPDPAHRGRSGQMIEYQAELEILEKVNSEKNIYRAMVTKSIVPLDVGAVLTPGRLPQIDPRKTPVTTGVGGTIIGGQYEKKRFIFGTQALVFIDAGAQAGLQVGQSLNIYADEKLRNKKTQANIIDRVIGQVKIVNVAPGFATGYVTNASADIMPGDVVGTRAVHASAAPASSFDTGTESDLEKEFENSPETPAAPAESGSDDTDLEL